MPRRHTDRRISGERSGLRTAAKAMIAVDEIDLPRWAASGHHQCVELVLVHHRVEALLPGEATILFKCREIARLRKWSFGYCLLEELLSEVRHLLFSMRSVE